MLQFIYVLVCLLCPIAFSQTIQIVQSSKAGDRFAVLPKITFGPLTSSANNLTLNPNDLRQNILGFGGAFTEAAAFNFFSVSEATQKKIIDAYFGPNGNHYSIGRFHINSCDFSLSSYSFDDTLWDFNLEKFDISHDYKIILPFIKEAVKTSATPIRLFGTPWSPSWWMKNGNINYGYMDGSQTPGLNFSCADTWANYMSRVFTKYSEYLGIPIWGMTPQNEPEFAAPWEACVYTPQDELKFIQNHLGPVLRRDHPNLKIMLYDHNKDHIVNWVQALVANPDAAKYVDGVAFHWYSGPQFENLAAAHNLAPNKFFLATEACNCPGVKIDDWSRGETYAYDIIGDLNNWAVGWTDWNMVLNSMGGPNHVSNYCDSPIVTYAVNDTFHLQPPYYTMGQISRYFVPETQIFSTTVSTKTLSAVSGKRPDGTFVTTVFNQQGTAENYQLIVGRQGAQISIPAHAIQTLIWTPQN